MQRAEQKPVTVQPKAAPVAPAAGTIRSRVIEAIAAIDHPCTQGEIYDQAGFTFKRRDMNSHLQSLLRAGLVTREQRDQWRYSLAQEIAESQQPEPPKTEPTPMADTSPISDPLLEKIAAIAPRRIDNAELHAARLRALGAWPALDAEVALWLENLAEIVENMA
jgi:DNA-binding transcriptional ArsR family regulator